MIIDFPFLRDVQAIPPRCRNAVRQLVIERLPLKVRALGPAEFPVAVSLVEGRFFQPLAGPEGAEAAMPEPLELHWDGRDLYRPWEVPSYANGATMPLSGLDAPSLQAALDAFVTSPFKDVQFGEDTCRRGATPVRLAEVPGRVTEDPRQDRVAEIISAARRVVLHNGRLYVPCPEPAWKIQASSQFTWVDAVFPDPNDLRHYLGSLFRADSLDDAVTEATRQAAWARHPEPQVRGVIDILLPDCIRFSPQSHALRKAARGALARDAEHLHKASVERMVAYARMRDALAEAPEPVVTPELAGAVRAYAETLGGEPGDMEHARESLQGALARWEADALRGLADLPDIAGGPVPR